MDAKREMLHRISDLMLSKTIKADCEAVQFVNLQQGFTPKPDEVPMRKEMLVMVDSARLWCSSLSLSCYGTWDLH